MSELERAPAVLGEKRASEPEIVRWVARHIDHPSPDPSECPDPFAWTLLRQCREEAGFVSWFIEKLWAKLIPSRSQLDTTRNSGLDGQVTIDLIERIEAIRVEAEVDLGAGAPRSGRRGVPRYFDEIPESGMPEPEPEDDVVYGRDS